MIREDNKSLSCKANYKQTVVFLPPDFSLYEKGGFIMVKICVDAGHGGSDTGATGYGIREKDITLKIAKKIQEYLGEYKDVSVKMSRTGDSYPSLTDRTNEANAWGADLFLSIHINSSGGTGYEDYRYTSLGVSSRTAKIQKAIHKAVLAKNRLGDRGMKTANFHVLRESKMSAVLTENGFIDTKSESDKMKHQLWISDVALGHANGIATYYGLKKNADNHVGGDGKKGKYGEIQITSKSGSVYVMDKPDRNNSDNLGTASGRLPLNGSMRGKNNANGYWEVEYGEQLGYVSANLAERV